MYERCSDLVVGSLHRHVEQARGKKFGSVDQVLQKLPALEEGIDFDTFEAAVLPRTAPRCLQTVYRILSQSFFCSFRSLRCHFCSGSSPTVHLVVLLCLYPTSTLPLDCLNVPSAANCMPVSHPSGDTIGVVRSRLV